MTRTQALAVAADAARIGAAARVEPSALGGWKVTVRFLGRVQVVTRPGQWA